MTADSEVMKWLVKNAVLSADTVAMQPHETEHKRTEAIVQRALEALLANGLITVTDPAQWLEYYFADPPYKNPFGS